MLMKALFTGGLLSVMAGSIVYFGTEGAIVDDQKTEAERVEIDATELAGGEIETAEGVETAELETLNPDQPIAGSGTVMTLKSAGGDLDKKDHEINTLVESSDSANNVDASELAETEDPPKKKWLDHYLKSESKSDSHHDAENEATDVSKEPQGHGSTSHSEEPQDHGSATHSEEPQAHGSATRPEESQRQRSVTHPDGPQVRWSTTNTDPGSSTTYADGADQSQDMPAPVEMKADENMGSSKTYSSGHDSSTSEKMMDGAVFDRNMRSDRKPTSSKEANVDFILGEARKIEIVDMRDEAILEILDYVLDHDKSGKAADILADLSSPELRDTARARIGVHLARSGKTKAAFAVMDEIEIEELRAPIRLEIITMLMATRDEKNRLKLQSVQ